MDDDWTREAVFKTNRVVVWLDEVAGSRKRELLTILLLSTMQGFLWTMMIPTIPLLAKDAGASEMQLGMITAIPALTTIIFCIPGNSLGLRYGKRTLIIWSQLAGLACGFLFLYTKSMGFIVVPQLFYGLSNMLFWPTESAYQTEVMAPEKRATAIGYTMALSSLGSILSPLVAGRIIDMAGYRPVFLLYITLSAVGVLIARTLPDQPHGTEGTVIATMLAGFSSVTKLLKHPIIQMVALNTFFQFLTLATSESFVPAFMREANYSATLIGTTVTLRTAAMTLVRFFIGPLVKTFGTVPVLLAGVFTCAIACGLVPVFPIPTFICIASFLAGLSFGVSPVLTSTIIAEHTDPQQRGMAMALNATSTNVGRSASGFGFGAVASLVGYGPAITIANCFVLLGSLFVVSKQIKMKRAESLPARDSI